MDDVLGIVGVGEQQKRTRRVPWILQGRREGLQEGVRSGSENLALEGCSRCLSRNNSVRLAFSLQDQREGQISPALDQLHATARRQLLRQLSPSGAGPLHEGRVKRCCTRDIEKYSSLRACVTCIVWDTRSFELHHKSLSPQAPVRGSASSAKYFPKHNIM